MPVPADVERRRLIAMHDRARRVGSVCRVSAGPWRAVCALLDHAEEAGLESSPWSTSVQPEAERVRGELDALLSAQREAEFTPYNSELVDTIVRGIETSLDEGELAFVVARLIDDHYWPSFTQEWLDERGRTFVLRGGERYPIGEMRLMGSIGHSSRPHRLYLPDDELPHVRRRSGEDNIRVVVEGRYAAILDGLAGRAPLTVAAALVNETWNELTASSGSIAPSNAAAQMARIRGLLQEARERHASLVVEPPRVSRRLFVVSLALVG